VAKPLSETCRPCRGVADRCGRGTTSVKCGNITKQGFTQTDSLEDAIGPAEQKGCRALIFDRRREISTFAPESRSSQKLAPFRPATEPYVNRDPKRQRPGAPTDRGPLVRCQRQGLTGEIADRWIESYPAKREPIEGSDPGL